MKSSSFLNVTRYSLQRQFVRSLSARKVPNLKSVEWCNKVLDVVEQNYGLHDTVLCLDQPGSGILADTALNSSLKHVIIWLQSRRGHTYLKNLEEKFPEKLSVTQSRFREETTKTMESLRGQGINKFLVLNHNFNLGYTAFQALTQFFDNNEMWKVAPVETLTFTTENVYKCLSLPVARSKKKYATFGSGLCELFFKHQLLLEIPANAFTCQVKLDRKEQADSLFLLGLSLREEFLSISDEEKSKLNGMICLMKQLNLKKTNRIIPHLERHCDGIGLDLINEGIGMMDEVRDILPSKWEKLHQIITSHPNFQHSLLKEVLKFDNFGEESHIS